MPSTISDQVRTAAMFSISRGPEPPAGMPIEKIHIDGLTVLLLPGPSGAMVEARALDESTLSETVERVRELLRERAKERAAWFVPEAAAPADLAARLAELALRPYDEAPFEPRFAAMARVEPPEHGPPDVEARASRTFEEYMGGVAVSDDAFDHDEADRRAWQEHRRTEWSQLESGASPFRSFVALLEGEIVGSAGALLCEHGINLIGGSVREDARGRGVYRALVRARWDLAAELGTPALTVQAGAMSRPILERLGFEIVGWTDCLLDRLGAGVD
jgi:GNAT superfamily N-acetyltransferase